MADQTAVPQFEHRDEPLVPTVEPKRSKWWTFAHVLSALAPVGVVVFAIVDGNPVEAKQASMVGQLVSGILDSLTANK